MPRLTFLLCAILAAPQATQPAELKVIVIAGEDAVNIIQQKTAVAPIVEVRDRNNLPVAGASVTFSISGSGASFGSAQTLTVITNAAGQAAASGLTPVTAGAVQINATAVFQGHTAIASIAQTNFATAQAAAAATASAGSGSGGAAAGGGGASSGGISGQTLAIIGGGAAAAAAGALVAGGAEAPAVGIAVTPQVTGIVDHTEFTFSARDAGDPSAVTWDFGDGQTGAGANATHIYTRPGSFQVTLRGAAGESATTTVSVTSLSGTWRQSLQGTCTPQPTHTTCVRNDLMMLTVQGNSIGGTWRFELDDGTAFQSPLVGTLNGRTLTIEQQSECLRALSGALSDDARSFVGRFEFRSANPNCLPRQVLTATWTRQ